jgi:ferrous iron transport protein A
MKSTDSTLMPLAALRRGESARIASLTTPAAQRLAMLGLRRGVELSVVHGPDARGAVLRVGTARIALGRELVDGVEVTAPAPTPK